MIPVSFATISLKLNTFWLKLNFEAVLSSCAFLPFLSAPYHSGHRVAINTTMSSAVKLGILLVAVIVVGYPVFSQSTSRQSTVSSAAFASASTVAASASTTEAAHASEVSYGRYDHLGGIYIRAFMFDGVLDHLEGIAQRANIPLRGKSRNVPGLVYDLLLKLHSCACSCLFIAFSMFLALTCVVWFVSIIYVCVNTPRCGRRCNSAAGTEQWLVTIRQPQEIWTRNSRVRIPIQTTSKGWSLAWNLVS